MKNLWVGLVVVVLISCGCDPSVSRLALVNDSDRPIYYCLQRDTVLEVGSFLYRVPPHDTARANFAFGGAGAWDVKINKSPDSTLKVYLFDVDSVTAGVIASRHYRRLEFKARELDSLGWCVRVDEAVEESVR